MLFVVHSYPLSACVRNYISFGGGMQRFSLHRSIVRPLRRAWNWRWGLGKHIIEERYPLVRVVKGDAVPCLVLTRLKICNLCPWVLYFRRSSINTAAVTNACDVGWPVEEPEVVPDQSVTCYLATRCRLSSCGSGWPGNRKFFSVTLQLPKARPQLRH